LLLDYLALLDRKVAPSADLPPTPRSPSLPQLA
jgi:hypothetical protein